MANLQIPLFESKQHAKGVKALLDSANGTLEKIPQCYVLPPSLRPLHTSLPSQIYPQVPLIDLSDLYTSSHVEVIQAIGAACKEWGFFQVINHGVPPSILCGMMQAVEQFFDLPFEDKVTMYSEDAFGFAKFGSSFNSKRESHLDWRDYLKHPLVPMQLDVLPHKPTCYKEAAKEYGDHMNKLSSCLMAAISESLGLTSNCLNMAFGKTWLTCLANHYPPCPNPELTIGQYSHSDAGCLTILLQSHVEALEVYHDGKWIRIKPIANALVINLGDQIQILTNEKYKSIQHRVISTLESRISIATLMSPALDATIAPLPSLLDSSHPPIYKEVVFREYRKSYLSEEIKDKTHVNAYKLDARISVNSL